MVGKHDNCRGSLFCAVLRGGCCFRSFSGALQALTQSEDLHSSGSLVPGF